MGPLSGQDRHFSDFRMAPTAINPALTGGFKGTYRINGIFRDQWRSISFANPYQTIVGSADFNIKAGLLLENDWLSGGVSFSSDKGGTSGFKQNLLGTQIGYHLGLDDDYKSVFSFGVSFGRLSTSLTNGVTLASELGNTQIDYGDVGYRGECNFPGCSNNASGQSQPGASDMSFGITYKTELEGGSLIRLGASWLHVNAPEQAVAQARGGIDSTIVNQRRGDTYRRNFVIFGEASTLVSSRLRVNPAFLLMQSSGTTEVQVQSTADYLLQAKDQISLTGGIGIRPLPSFDAAYLMGGVKIKDLTVRLTYDITLSSLRQAGGNSFELSVGYIGRIYKDPKIDKVIFCPRL